MTARPRFAPAIGALVAPPSGGDPPRLVGSPGIFQGSQSNATANITISPSTVGNTLIMCWLKTSQTGNTVNSVTDSSGVNTWSQFATPLNINGAEGHLWQKSGITAGITTISVNVSSNFGYSMFWGIETTPGEIGQRDGYSNPFDPAHFINQAPGFTSADGVHFATTWTYSSGRTWTAQDGWTLVGAAADRHMMQYKEDALTNDRGGPALTSASTDSKFISWTVIP